MAEGSSNESKSQQSTPSVTPSQEKVTHLISFKTGQPFRIPEHDRVSYALAQNGIHTII